MATGLIKEMNQRLWYVIHFFTSGHTQRMNRAGTQHIRTNTLTHNKNRKCISTSAHKRTHITGAVSHPSHPKQPFQKGARCLKQTLLCLHFINSLNSRVSLNYSCFKSIWRPHCSILFERSLPKISMSSLHIVDSRPNTFIHWHATLPDALVVQF